MPVNPIAQPPLIQSSPLIILTAEIDNNFAITEVEMQPKIQTVFDPKTTRFVKIPKKKKGEYREICVPSAELKFKLRKILVELNKDAFYNFGPEVQGFVPGRSPLTNSIAHIGYNFTLSFDLKNFFDAVTPDMVPEKYKNDCFVNNRAYQGLPTSPAIANLAARPMDKDILDFINNPNNFKDYLEPNVVYTRYADDLTFSFNEYSTYDLLRQNIPLIVCNNGFTINGRKTHLQTAKFGRRIITGIAVDDKAYYIPRAIKRKLRAASHTKQFARYYGLQEWSKLKLPNSDPIAINADIFTQMNEVNRVTNTLLKQNKYSVNYKFISDIQDTKEQITVKKRINKRTATSEKIVYSKVSDVKKKLKYRCRAVYKEMDKDRPGVSAIIKDIIYDKVVSRKKDFSDGKDLTDRTNSDTIAGNQISHEELAQSILV